MSVSLSVCVSVCKRMQMAGCFSDDRLLCNLAVIQLPVCSFSSGHLLSVSRQLLVATVRPDLTRLQSSTHTAARRFTLGSAFVTVK